MLLSDFLKKVGSVYLMNTPAFDTNATYKIKNEFVDKLIHIINNGLLELHTKFILLKKDCLIKIESPHTTYPIRQEYAISSGSSEPHKFIYDSVSNPFYPYLLRILHVIDENGVRLPINDYNALSSVFIPQYDVVQFSFLNIGSYFNITYQGYLPPLVNPVSTQVIDLPPYLFELLEYYVAYTYLGSLLGQNNNLESQKYMVIYNNKLNDIVLNGLVHMFDADTNLKHDLKGFI